MSAIKTEHVFSEEGEQSLCAAVVAAGARWSAGQRELVRLVTRLDASGEWVVEGAASCAHWVAAALDIEVCTAREWLRIGRALGGLAVIDAAFAEGRLSYSKLRALTRVATPENEVKLCELAERVPAGRLPHALAAWLQQRELPEETEARHRDARGLWWRTDVDGMIAGCFRLPPGDSAYVAAAIDAEVVRRRRPDASADASRQGERWPTVPQQRADALIELMRSGGAAVATEIVVHVRGDGCTLDDGTPIPASVVERIAPDSFLRALIHEAQGRPINASGRHRHPSARQRRVVHERDAACVDCGATEFLQYDHQPDYAQSRMTVVDQLKLRCWNCHRARHGSERARVEAASDHQA
jgi:hypothetical protein